MAFVSRMINALRTKCPNHAAQPNPCKWLGSLGDLQRHLTSCKLDSIKCAALSGDLDLQFSIGYSFEHGHEMGKQDITEAVKWYRIAAENGHAAAQFTLGGCYDDGNGVLQDKPEAAKWYRKAAEQGMPTAQFNLGVFYDNGWGVAKDNAEAVKWHREAAENGNVKAMYNLALCYDNGKGVVQDQTEAVKWYRKAAEQGHVDAQYNLAVSLKIGEGIAQDEAEAAVWFRKAADQGDKAAEEEYTLLTERPSNKKKRTHRNE